MRSCTRWPSRPASRSAPPPRFMPSDLTVPASVLAYIAASAWLACCLAPPCCCSSLREQTQGITCPSAARWVSRSPLSVETLQARTHDMRLSRAVQVTVHEGLQGHGKAHCCIGGCELHEVTGCLNQQELNSLRPWYFDTSSRGPAQPGRPPGLDVPGRHGGHAGGQQARGGAAAWRAAR